MSASKKKLARKEQTAQQPAVVAETPAQRKGPSGAFYGVIAGVLVVVVAALLVFNSNFFQNRAAAVTINGQDYTAADVNYYYASIYQYQSYYAMMGVTDLDPTKDPRDQIYNADTNQTWYDFMLDTAVDNLTQEVALAAEAEKAGMVLSEESQQTVQDALTSLEVSRLNAGYASSDAFLRTNMGSGMSYDKYVQCLERSALAAQYSNEIASTLEVSEEELDAYYAENKDDLDTYVISHYLFQARVPAAETDADGKAIERTEEEEAKLLEEAKKETKANADAMLKRLEAGEDAEALNEEFAELMSYSFVSTPTIGSELNTNYAEWAKDAGRKDGDTTIAEYAVGNSIYNYAVVRLESRYLDEAATDNIRHIFISAGTGATEEQMNEAKTKAQDMLDQWKAGGASEDAFAQLAIENSADESSAANGGLLNVSSYDTYGDAFKDWAADSSRKAGDTGLVENDFSATHGWHIMYYVGEDAPFWAQVAEAALKNEALNARYDELDKDYIAEKGDGLKYVG